MASSWQQHSRSLSTGNAAERQIKAFLAQLVLVLPLISRRSVLHRNTTPGAFPSTIPPSVPGIAQLAVAPYPPSVPQPGSRSTIPSVSSTTNQYRACASKARSLSAQNEPRAQTETRDQHVGGFKLPGG
eukprot:1361230-Rhodomonas_salina.1